MRIRFMLHKVAPLLCVVVFIFLLFVPEGYSQTQSDTCFPLKRATGRQDTRLLPPRHSTGFLSMDQGQQSSLTLNQNANWLVWSYSLAVVPLQMGLWLQKIIGSVSDGPI